MPEYLSPGVYVEEIDAGPKPIQGVSTSTAGAVGITRRGPTTGKPQLITSFSDFERQFGGFMDEPEAALVNAWQGNQTEGGAWWLFPLAVQGFFENGGQRLYVKRAFSSGAVASAGVLGRGFVSEVARDGAQGDLRITLRHLLRIDTTTALNIVNGETGQPIPGSPYVVSAYDATGTVTLPAPGLGAAVRAGRDFVEIVQRTPGPVAPADPNATLTITAKALGQWGNALQVRVRPMVGNTLSLLPDPSEGPVVVTAVTQDAAQNATSVIVRQIQNRLDQNTAVPFSILVNQGLFQVTAVAAGPAAPPPPPGGTPAPANVTLTLATAIPQAWPTGTAVKKLRRANPVPPSLSLHVAGAASLYPDALVELDNGTNKEIAVVQSVTGDQVTFSQALNNPYFEGYRLRVIEAEVAARYVPPGREGITELFSNLRLARDGSINNLAVRINQQSQLIQVAEGPSYSATAIAQFPTVPALAPPPPQTAGGWLQLGGGDDALNTLSVDDFVGEDGGSGNRTGIQALEDIDEVSLCLVPGMWSRTVQGELIVHCELLKDRFAILDPADGLPIEGIRAFREPIDTKYAALYYPWLFARDPLSRKDVHVPPSGHVAGIYARVDVERGVHKAPANEVVRGIRLVDERGRPGGGFVQDVTKREQDMLNPLGINALRFFPGMGHRVWGARTLTSDMSWKYVNVRRLFIFVEESIDEGTQWVVFEPNDEPLWARVRQSITNFLVTVWRNGALEGTTQEQAFFVACDRTTMTQDDIDNGRLICVIGIAPVKPAEFVIFRIQQKTREMQPA